MPSSSTNHKRGVDALLTASAKSLPVGGTCRFRLVKGPVSIPVPDPVDPAAPPQLFPLIAKFPESVVKPDFTTNPWKQGRLYQQDIPKPADDSDDEDNNNKNNKSAEDGGGAPKKKRWKYNRQYATERQWILQEQVDFLETMVARRENKQQQQQGSNNNNNNTAQNNKLSSRYEGVPEHNSSHYALFLATTTTKTTTTTTNACMPTLHIQTIPAPHGTIPFSQPAARTSLSLSQAEQAIQDQRAGIRTMRSEPVGTNNNGTAAAAGTVVHKIPALRLPSRNSSKHRLLDKLDKKEQQNDDGVVDEADDIMGDVGYRNRKGGGSAARRELLSTLGDGLAVSQEGVLGGTNDAAFGGRGDRFGQLAMQDSVAGGKAGGNDNDYDDDAGGGGAKGGVIDSGTAQTERGADGAAMEDDFYQRDVKAEYEELDYDANEQFDDDDVDLGESEVVVDTGGYGDEDEEVDLEELEEEEEAVGGAEGLATAAGFRAMLAKARGESPVLPATAAEGGEANAPGNGSDKKEDFSKKAASAAEDEGGKDHMAKIMAAADKAAQAAKDKVSTKKGAAGQAPSTEPLVIQVDENGLRIISVEAVRREIWLNHGSIPMKRLMKIFEIKKKSTQERQTRFREVVKELCTMKTDAVDGRMLVLKQHYANMG